jgi:hypothetical protein
MEELICMDLQAGIGKGTSGNSVRNDFLEFRCYSDLAGRING